MHIVPNVNSVQNIKNSNNLKLEDKVLIKQKGRPTPDLQIKLISTSTSQTYWRHFHRKIYEKYGWMCGCELTNKLFCFCCLLLRKESSLFISYGVDDLQHIGDKARRHENSSSHINACIDFAVLGVNDLNDKLSSAYLLQTQKHNENVDKNRHILRRLIMCIKFCGTFELALREHNERSDNEGIYLGLIDFAAELDSILGIDIREATIFKDTLKIIQDELLDAMYIVYKNEVTRQINSANFLAIEAEEATDTSNQQQLVVLFRYVFEGQICERFWSFIKPSGYTAQILSSVLLRELQTELNISSDKLISQSYDGTSVMSGKNNGVQSIIRQTYPNAYFVHCYAHQPNLIMERAAQCNKTVTIFFAHLQAFSSFFSQSTKRTSFLDEAVKQRLAPVLPALWKFKSKTVNTLYAYKYYFKECLEKIMDNDEVDFKTLNEAHGLLNSLNSQEFLYWLKVFYFIMPHVEIFFNQAQTPGIDSTRIRTAVEHFETEIIKIRNLLDNFSLEVESTNASDIAKEVCDAILMQIKDRFDFNEHLCAAKLFESKNFLDYRKLFPLNYFNTVVTTYSVLNGEKLKNELMVLYTRDDMRYITSIPAFLMFIRNNNLTHFLSQTYKLLDIICTMPMLTSASERCFSTSKRIKTFLRNTMVAGRLNALAVLSVEKEFVQSILDYDNKVIEIFCNNTNRRADFHYN